MEDNKLEKSALQITLDNIDAKVTRIEKQLESNYVTKDQFEPVKRIVYGLVSLVLVSVAGAVVALVLK